MFFFFFFFFYTEKVLHERGFSKLKASRTKNLNFKNTAAESAKADPDFNMK